MPNKVSITTSPSEFDPDEISNESTDGGSWELANRAINRTEMKFADDALQEQYIDRN